MRLRSKVRLSKFYGLKPEQRELNVVLNWSKFIHFKYTCRLSRTTKKVKSNSIQFKADLK